MLTGGNLPALRPPRALAMLSALIADLAAWNVPVRSLGGSHLDCRELLDPRTQIVREHKRAATTFDCTQLARFDCFIEGGAASACYGTRLSY
jgi:hypothetical protein